MRFVRTPLLLLAVALLATPLACSNDGPSASAGSSGLASSSLKGMVRTEPLQVGSVSLPRADDPATPFTTVAPDGGLLLVYFGYTSCPDVCPTTLSDLRVALDTLPAELRSRVTVAMETVDPERDTAEVMSSYLKHFVSDGVALRQPDPVALKQAADAFGVQFEVAEHEPGENYEVSHTGVTYVVDDTGTVVVEWPFGFGSDDMASDLAALLRKADAA